MNKYGELPKDLGHYNVDIREMLFYQYLPIKFPGKMYPIYEQRLKCFDKLVGAICCHFIAEYGLNRYTNSYVYLTAKHLYQLPGCSFNRLGWHSDGFLTEDINYIWSDKSPTIFNYSDFNLTLDDSISLIEMSEQAQLNKNVTYPENRLLRLNQYNIHKVNDSNFEGMRSFLKISFSDTIYDLEGNTHNYELKYVWKMRSREVERNIPQNINKKEN